MWQYHKYRSLYVRAAAAGRGEGWVARGCYRALSPSPSPPGTLLSGLTRPFLRRTPTDGGSLYGGRAIAAFYERAARLLAAM